jgi:hypothetical protein
MLTNNGPSDRFSASSGNGGNPIEEDDEDAEWIENDPVTSIVYKFKVKATQVKNQFKYSTRRSS